MSTYKTSYEIKEEAKRAEPNPYLKGTWAWIEYEKVRKG